jgi:hypothetical protein
MGAWHGNWREFKGKGQSGLEGDGKPFEKGWTGKRFSFNLGGSLDEIETNLKKVRDNFAKQQHFSSDFVDQGDSMAFGELNEIMSTGDKTIAADAAVQAAWAKVDQKLVEYAKFLDEDFRKAAAGDGKLGGFATVAQQAHGFIVSFRQLIYKNVQQSSANARNAAHWKNQALIAFKKKK